MWSKTGSKLAIVTSASSPLRIRGRWPARARFLLGKSAGFASIRIEFTLRPSCFGRRRGGIVGSSRVTASTVGRHAEEGASVKIGAPKEVFAGEARVAMTPDSAAQLRRSSAMTASSRPAPARPRASPTTPTARPASRSVETAAALWEAGGHRGQGAPARAGRGRSASRPGQTLISFFYPAQNEELLRGLQEPGRHRRSRWTWCRASAARRRWTRCRRWPTSPATAR